MILAKWLFVETVSDVQRRRRHRAVYSRYELLGIAPLLRKLLIDQRPLLDTVKSDRLEGALLFDVHPWRPPLPGEGQEELQYELRLGTPDVGAEANTPTEGVPSFLSTVVVQVGGDDLTVKHVIRYYVHVEGGVHFGVAGDPVEAKLARMAPLLVGHSNGQIEILARLGRVTAQALAPLQDHIFTHPTVNRGLHRPTEDGLRTTH
ncbi:hypothetical protein [Rathayibacter rathayi]|uniref:hypothetical protein n=1 Tax=Rathayibacter rathayi TaxID=33887 RepID=UPI0011B02723|nr:hypothetical protein [Rathayibacter rathayi]